MNSLKRILAAVLLLALVASVLFSCKKDKPDETTAATDADPADADFDLVSTANPTFDYFRADLSAYLTLTEADYNGLPVSLDLTDGDVDDYLNEYLLPSHRTPNLTTDVAVKDGDKIYVWYVGYTDDFPFDGGSNADDEEPYSLKIGESELTFPGFDTALIGTVPESTSDENPLTVNVTFPADYEDERLAGKDARFKVVIIGIVDGDALVPDRAVQNGDTVKIRYTGYTDDYAFTGGSNMEYDEPYELEIGSNSFINGFEDALIGVIPSETSKDNLHTITVTFPADYRNTDLAGKEARFDVAIDGIFDGTYTTPELTADFITNVLKFETEETDVVAAYRADLLKQMRESKVENLESHKLSRIIDALLDKVSFGDALPEGEAERFENGWIEDIEYYYEYYNYMSSVYYGSAYFEDLDEAGREYVGLGPDGDWRAFLHEYAEKLVKQYLVLNTVARLSAITISEDEAKEWIRGQADQNGVEVSAVLAHYSIEEVYSLIAAEKAQRILLTLAEFDYGELPIAAEAAE